tara:strand:+ start:56 stop:451 length:396 start_codon:yes stop_codon:yes gene_type:complete
MKNIKLTPDNNYLKILLYLMVLILIFIINSKIVFSKSLNKNSNNINSPEKELAIKYCDAINKKIFDGLNKEASLKYEYYFSALRKPKNKNYKLFFKEFRLNLMKNCFYKLTEEDKKEFETFIKKFLYQKTS